MGKQPVVTYQLPHLGRTAIGVASVSLCEKHEKNYPGLGPVQRGQHDGVCDVCSRNDAND